MCLHLFLKMQIGTVHYYCTATKKLSVKQMAKPLAALLISKLNTLLGFMQITFGSSSLIVLLSKTALPLAFSTNNNI